MDDGDGFGGWGTNFEDRVDAGGKRFQTPQERFEDEMNTFVNSNSDMSGLVSQVKSLFPYIPRYYYYNPPLLYIAYKYLSDNGFKLSKKSFEDFYDSYEFFALKIQKTKKRAKERTRLTSKADFLRYIRLVDKALTSKKH